MQVTSRMKQRVAVALATVWLTSIVGASVPSGETTTFSTLRPPGPSPDQYTPLLGNPRYHPQDDYSQDWMNDEPSRIKVANRQGNSDRGQTTIAHSDGSLPQVSSSNEFFNEKMIEDTDASYRFESYKKPTSDKDREAMRLSSMKVAFDDPINSEQSDDNSKEKYWIKEDTEEDEGEIEDEDMQRDEFVSDDTFEDEGPGSVEVYKLDLYKDRSILSQRPIFTRKPNFKNKSKLPKKVGAVDRMIFKSQDTDESKQQFLKRFDQNPHEFSTPAMHFKERIFGVGGVPELQVGCEGAEDFQRQKRSDLKLKNSGETKSTDGSSIGESQLYIDVDGDSEEDDSDFVPGNDELFKILSIVSTTTDSSLVNKNRGDMDPRVKTPADLAVKKKDKLPIRGDLGPEGDPNLNDGLQDSRNISKVNNSSLNHQRKLLSVEENNREKRSLDSGFYGENESLMKKREKVRRGDGRIRRHRGGSKRRQRKLGKNVVREKNNEIRMERRRRNNKAIDKINGGDYFKTKENRVRKNPSNLLRHLPTRQGERRSAELKRRRIKAENARKLQDYIRRNTPIQPPQVLEQKRPKVETVSKNDYNNQLEKQFPQEVNTNRAEYDREMEELRMRDQKPSAPSTQYKRRSPQEIARLNSLPVSAQIIIRQDNKPNNSTLKIESRLGAENEVSYQGLNPSNNGIEVPKFPVVATSLPPSVGPSLCAWAIITCCSNQKRLASCFETKGCVGAHWDPDACSQKNMAAALQIIKTYVRG